MKKVPGRRLPNFKRMPMLALPLVVLAACSTGATDISELYYLKLTNGTDSAYVRIQVEGAAQLSDTKYKSGWFPADAVDSVLGNVADDTTGKTRAARESMRDQLIEALKKAHKDYLAVALRPEASEEEIRRALRSWERTRLAPLAATSEIDSAIIVEFNPGQGLETFRSDEKLVFVLSANPDDVIRTIGQVANDEATKAAIQRFANVLVEGAKAEVEVKKANAAIAAEADKFLAVPVTDLAQAMKDGSDSGNVIDRAEALLALLRGLANVGGQP